MQKYEGFPLGSMVLYATDDSGRPILAISSLSPHTKVGRTAVTLLESFTVDPVPHSAVICAGSGDKFKVLVANC